MQYIICTAFFNEVNMIPKSYYAKLKLLGRGSLHIEGTNYNLYYNGEKFYLEVPCIYDNGVYPIIELSEYDNLLKTDGFMSRFDTHLLYYCKNSNITKIYSVDIPIMDFYYDEDFLYIKASDRTFFIYSIVSDESIVISPGQWVDRIYCYYNSEGEISISRILK